MMVNDICFSQDTKERKQWFTGMSFSHPAKMHLSLQIYLLEHYTKAGETILDPMSGSGTILFACTLGRNVVCVELEEKFCKMQKDNWEKIKGIGPMLGHKMGEAVILQGDARDLGALFADKIVFSPPYAETNTTGRKNTYKGSHGPNSQVQLEDYRKSAGNIGNLPYGSVDKVITSPPFSEQMQDTKWMQENQPRKHRGAHNPKEQNPSNIGNLKYKANTIITSPPYEESVGHTGKDDYPILHEKSLALRGSLGYGDRQNENIGNLKSANYLDAMLQVYRQCYGVLKDKGLLILVTKNFIRDKKLVRLDLDTIKLCEQVGFVLKERLKRKLMQQSFWRTIYYKKFPDAPRIDFEDVLIFEKH